MSLMNVKEKHTSLDYIELMIYLIEYECVYNIRMEKNAKPVFLC
jgi:hypothetical protein